MPRRHGESGEFVETVSLEDVIGVFDAVNGPAILSADVADTLECSRETARRKLGELYERGDLNRRKVSRRMLYWRAGESRREEAPTASTAAVDRRPSDTTPEAGAGTDGDTRPFNETAPDDLDAVVDDVAEGWEGGEETIEARKAAARAVLSYVREHGKVSKQEAIEEIEPEHTIEGQNPGTWYRKNIRPVLNEVAEYDQTARAYELKVDRGDQ